MRVWKRCPASWTVSFLVVVLLAMTAGCGSDGDDSAGGAAQVAGASTSDAAAGGSDDEQEIRTLFDRMSAAIESRDAEAACPLMARSAQRTFVMLAEGGPRTCERGFAVAFAEGLSEASDPRLVRVELQGPRATVYARTKNRQLERAPFVKEGGRWRVESWLTD